MPTHVKSQYTEEERARRAQLFARLGQLLYGNEWKTPMAEHLGVRQRTIYRWLGRNWDIPPEHLRTLNDDAQALLAEMKMLAEIFRELITEDEEAA